jgi:hypothetical protein
VARLHPARVDIVSQLRPEASALGRAGDGACARGILLRVTTPEIMERR